jgi:FxsC-like protein
MTPYFFFSYAHNDVDHFFNKFYDDLCKEVAAVTTRDIGEVGFRDHSGIGLGRLWPQELIRALRTCECFVPVLSPRLLARPYCGKEWHLFQDRLRTGQPPDPGHPSRLLPVLWRPLAGDLPEVIRNFQRTHASLGDVYAEKGLLTLVKLKKFRDEYNEFLSSFAAMMMDAVAAAELPPAAGRVDVDMESTPDAFNSAPARISSQVPVESAADHVLLVIAAGAESDLKEKGRHEVSAYGSSWRQWRPFAGSCAETAVVAAQMAVGRLSLSSEPAQFDDAMVARLEEIWQLEKSAKGRPFVILLDPWSIDVPPYKSSMQWFDGYRFRSGAVLQVWPGDIETKERTSDLRARIQEVIRGLCETGSSTSLFKVHADKAEFGEELVKIVTKIQARLLGTWREPRVVEGATTGLPQLQGPGGGSDDG